MSGAGRTVPDWIETEAQRIAARVLAGHDDRLGWRDAGYRSALDAARVLVGANGMPEDERAAEIVADSLREYPHA